MLHLEDSGGKRKPIRERDLSLRHLYMKLIGAEEWSVRLTLRVNFIENAYWPFQNSAELELKHTERLSEVWSIPWEHYSFHPEDCLFILLFLLFIKFIAC